MTTRLHAEGMPELRRLLRRLGPEAVKAQGELHKEVGREWVSWLGGPASGIGAGAGASYRPSASRREVILRVGHGGRSRHVQQWGKRWTPERGKRPNVLGAAEDHLQQITDKYLDGVDRIIRQHGF